MLILASFITVLHRKQTKSPSVIEARQKNGIKCTQEIKSVFKNVK